MGGELREPRALVDTGALIGLLDRSDRHHGACVRALSTVPLPLGTSAAVLTELFHFLEPHEYARAWALLRSGSVVVLPIADDDSPELELLMARYLDRPMDFADATLVLLARRHRLTTVFTVDRADFETYRIESRQRFQVVPKP